jgi:phosphotriesterase-related protein
MATVNTVTGEISPNDLGLTLMHEHFFFGYPGYQGDHTLGPFDRDAIIATGVQVAEAAKAHGVKTIVDATPNDCGRDAEMLREISEKSEVQIVCSTGYYYEAEGAPAYFKFRQGLGTAEGEIEEMMMTEISSGIGTSGIKPGVIKLASSKDEISDYEAMFFRVGAKAQKEHGIPIITHTQEGTMAPEQAAMLIAEGADPNHVMIGHMDGNTDPAYHRETLSHGVNIAFDRFGVQGIVGMPMDDERYKVVLDLLSDEENTSRMMLSHDTVNVWLGRPLVLPEALGPLLANWHITHVFDNVIPHLKESGISEDRIETMMVENPRRLFGG